jgi:hypothetical protein
MAESFGRGGGAHHSLGQGSNRSDVCTGMPDMASMAGMMQAS